MYLLENALFTQRLTKLDRKLKQLMALRRVAYSLTAGGFVTLVGGGSAVTIATLQGAVPPFSSTQFFCISIIGFLATALLPETVDTAYGHAEDERRLLIASEQGKAAVEALEPRTVIPSLSPREFFSLKPAAANPKEISA